MSTEQDIQQITSSGGGPEDVKRYLNLKGLKFKVENVNPINNILNKVKPLVTNTLNSPLDFTRGLLFGDLKDNPMDNPNLTLADKIGTTLGIAQITNGPQLEAMTPPTAGLGMMASGALEASRYLPKVLKAEELASKLGGIETLGKSWAGEALGGLSKVATPVKEAIKSKLGDWEANLLSHLGSKMSPEDIKAGMGPKGKVNLEIPATGTEVKAEYQPISESAGKQIDNLLSLKNQAKDEIAMARQGHIFNLENAMPVPVTPIRDSVRNYVKDKILQGVVGDQKAIDLAVNIDNKIEFAQQNLTGERLNTVVSSLTKTKNNILDGIIKTDMPEVNRMLNLIEARSKQGISSLNSFDEGVNVSDLPKVISFETLHNIKKDIYRIVKKSYGDDTFNQLRKEGLIELADNINQTLRKVDTTGEYAKANDELAGIYDAIKTMGLKGTDKLIGMGGANKIRALWNDPVGKKVLGGLDKYFESPITPTIMDKENVLRRQKLFAEVPSQAPVSSTIAGGVIGTLLGLPFGPVGAGGGGLGGMYLSSKLGSPRTIRNLLELQTGTAKTLSLPKCLSVRRRMYGSATLFICNRV